MVNDFSTCTALELVRTLMHCDIADDILKALVGLLHPQREIELGKLFNEAAKSADSGCSETSSSEDEEDYEDASAVGGDVDGGGGGGADEANGETERSVDFSRRDVRDFSGPGECQIGRYIYLLRPCLV